MKYSMLAVFTAALALSTTAAFAADKPAPSPAQEEAFKQLDTNHDGVISKDEWRARGDKMFDEMDANHDGKVTLEEKAAYHKAKEAEWSKQHPRVGTAAAAKLQNAAPAKP